MAVLPDDLLRSAKDFCGIAKNESDYRGCISRGYYAGFHAAKIFHQSLSSSGKLLGNCGEHENLLHMLNNPTIPETDGNHLTSREIYVYLKKILFNRRLADYQIDQPVNKKKVDIVFAESNLLFDALN